MNDHDEIESLRAEIADLRLQLERLVPQVTTAPSPRQAVEPAQLTRRGWIRAAAGAAVVGTAVALHGQPASAADGDAVRVGRRRTGTAGTQVDFVPGTDDVGFLAQAGSAFDVTSSSVKAALAGWSTVAENPVGVYGYSSVVASSAVGVRGDSQSASGLGMKAVNRSPAGTALYADGGGGPDGVGLRADGGIAVVGAGTNYGASLRGGQAGLRIVPINGVPAARADQHFQGELDGSPAAPGTSDLWACVADGTPGVWRKLAGPGTAGSFHPIDPVRAFDSRRPAPSPGLIASGASRVISVADGRDLASGAVTVANAVPSGATAITYNLTITGTGGAGFLAVSPGDAVALGASTINWAGSSVTIANAGVSKLDGSRQIKVFAGGAGSTHFIVDVTGFYL